MLTVIFALATYRIARLVARDDGPGDILLTMRTAIKAMGTRPPERYDFLANAVAEVTVSLWWFIRRRWIVYAPFKVLSKLIECTHCNSVWIGVPLGIQWAAVSGMGVTEGILAGVAFSGFTVIVENYIP